MFPRALSWGLCFFLFLSDKRLNPALENMTLLADDATDHNTSKNIQKISSRIQMKTISVNK